MSHKLLSRFVILSIILVLCLALIPGCAQSQPKQVLMILFEKSEDMNFMLVNEVGVMKDSLTKAGFKVVTASETGAPLGSGDSVLKPDMKTADAKMADYVGLIDPCMARTGEIATSPATAALIKDAVAQGKPVAAQLGGVVELYDVGVLTGKQYAFYQDPSGFLTNAIYKGQGVVQDGKIITGGVCPNIARQQNLKDTTVELTQKFLEVLKAQ